MDKLLLDDDVLALVLELKAMASKLRAKGLDDDTLKDIVLTGDGKGISLAAGGVVTLLDYGVTVKFNPMEKTLYTLFLNNADGIHVDDFWKYYDELVEIYRKMTRFEDEDAILDAVDNVLDDSRVTLYANLSRIKKKITLGVIALILLSAIGRLLMFYGNNDQWRWLCLLPWLPIVLYSLIIIIDSSIRNRSLRVGLLSVPAAFTQRMGYGLGFIESWWKRCVLKQDEFTAFDKNFYK